jgi:hypothetical protein
MRPEDQPYMALGEVAACFGVTRQAAYSRSRRSDFPAPVAHLKMGSVWATPDIVKFKGVKKPRRKVHGILTHGQARRGMRSATYCSWESMLNRCRNPRHPTWKYYGGAGVKVCARWDPAQGGSFQNFLADLGPMPEGKLPSGRTLYSIGRFGDMGDYEPSNCKWMTPAEQGANRRSAWKTLAALVARV